jgi:hypothetical protein
MLLSSNKCSLCNQQIAHLQDKYAKEFLAKDNREPSSILLDLFSILNTNEEIRTGFLSEAYNVLVGNNVISADLANKSITELAVYGFAMCSMFLVVTPAKEEIVSEAGKVIQKASPDKFELHTSSYSLLVKLVSEGVLVGAREPIQIELSKFLNRLTSSANIRPALQKGSNLVTVRLEATTNGRETKLVGKAPRSAINLRESIIIPIKSLESAMKLFTSYISEHLVEVGMEDKVRFVTKNKQVLSSIYSEERANQLCSYTYNSLTNNMYVPFVGASIYTAGVTSINLPMVDYVRKASLTEVDLGDIRVNIGLAPNYFTAMVKHLKKAQLVELATYLGVENADTLPVKALRESCLTSSKVKYDKDMYVTMKALPNLFNLDEFKNQKSKIGVLNEEEELPKTRDELYNLMRTGIFKVTKYDRSGKMKVLTVTSSAKELERVYGRNYVGKYEGVKVRALHVRALIDKVKGDIVPKKRLQLWESTYKLGLPTDADTDKFVLSEILSNIETASSERRTVVNNPEYVLVRNCSIAPNDENKARSFYKQLDLASIVGITRLSTVSEAKKPEKEVKNA